jgi:putative transposase
MDYNSHMPRANRYFVPGYACHLTHRCHSREFLLRFATGRDRYRMLLREGMLEFGIALVDFCITSNHVHLLAFADEDERISAFMRKVQGQFGQAYNRHNERSGAFWDDRYHSTLIEPGRHLEECLVYVALNMVRCRVVGHPQEWPWCGYQELMGLRRRYRVLDSERLLLLLGKVDMQDFQRNYLAMIKERIAQDRIQREPQWTECVAVGSERFVRSIESRIQGRQQMEVVGDGDRWMLRETGAEYDARRRSTEA